MNYPASLNVLSSRTLGVLLLGLVLLAASGCGVPQPRGDGQLSRVVEPTMKRGYWRYLPAEYVQMDDRARRTRPWPVVVTFHGMKPFDNAHPQALEWEAEADRYGFIVVAPELRALDVLAQFPVRTVHHSFREDEKATLAILDHLFATTAADRSNVLSTSWSSGGYMAHYMLNRHPDRFSALGVRQSNFSSSILDADITRLSREHPILILNTQNDFAICKEESREAVQWYERHGYRNLGWIHIKDKGHERTPDMAAYFFSRLVGVQPRTPPVVLARRQAIDGNEAGLAIFTGRSGNAPAPTGRVASAPPPAQPTPPRVASARPTTSSPPPRRSAPPSGARSGGAIMEVMPVGARTAAGRPGGLADGPVPTPTRSPAIPTVAGDMPRAPVNIQLSAAIGIDPLLLAFSADCPPSWRDTADFFWSLNGAPIGSGLNGQKTITAAGDHTLALLVVTRDGQEYRAARSVRVLPRISASSAGNR